MEKYAMPVYPVLHYSHTWKEGSVNRMTLQYGR